MEIVTLTALLAEQGCSIGNILAGVLAGFITNYSDRGLANLDTVVKAYFNRENQFLNHDVEKALSRSFLRSLHTIASECLDELYQNRSNDWNDVISASEYPVAAERPDTEETLWLKRKKRELETKLKKVEEAQKETPIFSKEELQLLLQPSPPQKRVAIVRAKLNQTVADSPIICYKDKAEATLFERICAFFAWEIKNTPEVCQIFQTGLLVEINTTLQSQVTVDDVENALRNVANQVVPQLLHKLDNFQEAIAQVGGQVEEVRALVTSSTTNILEAIATRDGDIETIKALLQQLLANLPESRRPCADAIVPVYSPPVATDSPLTVAVRTGPNPFDYGTPVAPDRFYGRRKAILDVKNRIGGISPQSINIVGMRRNGKTSLLRYIKERTDIFFTLEQQPLIILLDLQLSQFHTPEGIIEGLRRGITQATGTEPWGREFNDDPFDVEDGLHRIRDNRHRLIVMLDEFERIGARLEQFQDWGEDWRAKASAGLLTMVITSLRPLSEVYQTLNLTSPFGNLFNQTILGALEEQAWHTMVQDGFTQNGDGEALPESALQWIDDLAGGLPFYTKMAAAMLWQYGDLEQATAEFIFQTNDYFPKLW